jgi:predicted transcriptional regulator with HTH domain
MEESIRKEMEEYLKGAAFKSDKTIASYKNGHKRITNALGKTIHKSSPKEIIDTINELATNPNTKSSLLNVGIIFYNLYEKNASKLLKYKTEVQKEIVEMRDKSLIEKGKILPTTDELEKYLKSLFVNERWGDFILMWLMVRFNTRNADVDVEIVNTIHETKKDKTRNYLVKRREDFVFIRNNYKTAKTYKQKRHIFKDPLMTRAVRYFTAEMPPNMPLFVMNHNGERLVDSSIANYMKRVLPEGITESDINKIQVSEIESMADFDKLLEMADKRGTNVETLITHYKLKFDNKNVNE